VDTSSISVRWPFYTTGTTVSIQGTEYTWEKDLNKNGKAETNELCKTVNNKPTCTLDPKDIALLQSFNDNGSNFVHIILCEGVEVNGKKYPVDHVRYSEETGSINYIEFKESK
jgi:hypothetical protein